MAPQLGNHARYHSSSAQLMDLLLTCESTQPHSQPLLCEALPPASFPPVSWTRGPSCCPGYPPTPHPQLQALMTPQGPRLPVSGTFWPLKATAGTCQPCPAWFSGDPEGRGAGPPGSSAPSSRYALPVPTPAPGSPAPPQHLCSAS